MAKGNTYTCFCCGLSYRYCPTCSTVKPIYNIQRFCCKKHAEIFEILSKHGCTLATAEETLKALEGYDLSGLTEGITNHIESLKPKKKRVKVVKEVQVEEPEIQE